MQCCCPQNSNQVRSTPRPSVTIVMQHVDQNSMLEKSSDCDHHHHLHHLTTTTADTHARSHGSSHGPACCHEQHGFERAGVRAKDITAKAQLHPPYPHHHHHHNLVSSSREVPTSSFIFRLFIYTNSPFKNDH